MKDAILLDATLNAFAVIGGLTAIWSSFLTGLGLIRGVGPDELQHQSLVGLAIGGLYGVPSALVLFFLELTQVIP